MVFSQSMTSLFPLDEKCSLKPWLCKGEEINYPRKLTLKLFFIPFKEGKSYSRMHSNVSDTYHFEHNEGILLALGVLLCFCLVGESQNGCGEFLKLGRRILNSIDVIMAVNIPLGWRIKNLDRRIKNFFLSWAGEICRSPGQNKTPVACFGTNVTSNQ